MKMFKVRIYTGVRLYVGWVMAMTQREADAYGRLRTMVL